MTTKEKPYVVVDKTIADAVMRDIDQGITPDTIATIRQDISKRVDRRHLARRAKLARGAEQSRPANVSESLSL